MWTRKIPVCPRRESAPFCAPGRSFFSDGYRLQQNLLPWAQISSLQPPFVPRNATFLQMGTVSGKTLFPGNKYLLYSHFPCPRTLAMPRWVSFPTKHSSLGTNIFRGHSLLPWAQISWPRGFPQGESIWLCHIVLQFLPHNLLQNLLESAIFRITVWQIPHFYVAEPHNSDKTPSKPVFAIVPNCAQPRPKCGQGCVQNEDKRNSAGMLVLCSVHGLVHARAFTHEGAGRT